MERLPGYIYKETVMEKIKVKDKKYRRREGGDSGSMSMGPVSAGGMLPGYIGGGDGNKKKKKRRGGFSVFPVNR